jgi:hypothetical protein
MRMQRWVIISGVVLVVIGLLWPWLGKLPGDIHIEREGSSFHFPLTTCLVISLVLTLVFWLFRE